MSVHTEFELETPAAEARAFFVLRPAQGGVSFIGATEVFAGTLEDPLDYV